MPPREFSETITAFEGDSRTPLAKWVGDNLDRVKARMIEQGAVLLRGFAAMDDDLAEVVLAQIDAELLDDAFWSTPRTGVSKKTFTATEFASNRSIALHSEMSYMPAWPRLIAFHALEVASEGGETTVCNLDVASAAMGEVAAKFAEKGVIYQRSYHKGIDIPWQKAFRSEDRDEVERIAALAGMRAKWLDNGVLQTEHLAQGAVRAESGAPLWFNQAHVFHPSTLGAARAQLEQLLGADKLPRNALFGDRSVINAAEVAQVHHSFDTATAAMGWRAGDILLLDNMRFAHGRAPFKGQRKLHVAMARSQNVPARTPLFA